LRLDTFNVRNRCPRLHSSLVTPVTPSFPEPASKRYKTPDLPPPLLSNLQSFTATLTTHPFASATVDAWLYTHSVQAFHGARSWIKTTFVVTHGCKAMCRSTYVVWLGREWDQLARWNEPMLQTLRMWLPKEGGGGVVGGC
jgi:hypothetical protein